MSADCERLMFCFSRVIVAGNPFRKKKRQMMLVEFIKQKKPIFLIGFFIEQNRSFFI
jgi:hypothetical protein